LGSVLNFKRVMGMVGIALITWNILLLIPVPILPIVFWVVWVFPDVVIGYVTFLITVVFGLVLYIVGRKELSQTLWGIDVFQVKPYELLMLLGLILAASSFWFLGFVTSSMQNDWTDPGTSRDWTVYQVELAWGGLGFLSGAVWLIDGMMMEEVEAPPLKQGIELGSQTKYSKDLLAKYTKQYPHNPTGVLEWHIHKKMKEGKTREQAIEELEDMQ